jgi:hypothetical protein
MPPKKKVVEAPVEVASEVVDVPVSAVAAYVPFYAELAGLEKDNAAVVFDYESKAGNKEARSHIYKLRKTKAALEAARTAAKEKSRLEGIAIDTEAKEIKARVEAMIDVHQKPLDEIEAREAAAVAALQAKLDAIVTFGKEATTTEDLKYAIDSLFALDIDDSFGDKKATAKQAKAQRLTELGELHKSAYQHEQEQLELAESRRKIADLERAAREKDIADKAAAAATKAAEDRARADKDAADRQVAEANLKAENAKRAAEEAQRQSEAKQQAAVEAERARAQAEANAAASASKARSEDEQHRAKFNREALDAMLEAGLDEAVAKRCVSLIVKGLIPHITMTY